MITANTLMIILSLSLGALLPSLNSRILKAFDCETGFNFAYLFHKPIFPKTNNIQRQKKLKKLWLKFCINSFIYSIVFLALYLILNYFFSFEKVLFLFALIWGVTLLAMIDSKVLLLPDFLTIPLLLLGFIASFYTTPIVEISESLWGAVFGYFLPLIVASFLQHKSSDIPIGGGDVKIFSALGAWFGIYWFNILLVISCLVFAVINLVKNKRAGPLGPSLAVGTAITLFLSLL